MTNSFRRVSVILVVLGLGSLFGLSAFAAQKSWNGRVYDVVQARFLNADEIR